MSDATTDMSLQESCKDAARHLSVEIHLLTAKTDELERENAKLRELVRDMYLCSDETCTDCEYHDYSGEGFWCKRGIGWKKTRMRELGIEVTA